MTSKLFALIALQLFLSLSNTETAKASLYLESDTNLLSPQNVIVLSLFQEAYSAKMSSLSRSVTPFDGLSKPNIDNLVGQLPFYKKTAALKELDAAIKAAGGFHLANPEQRYALIRLLQDRNIIINCAQSLECLSSNGKTFLLGLCEQPTDFEDRSYNFSKVACAIFSGMIKDETFAGFCEQVQNNGFRLMKNTPNVLLIDDKTPDGYSGIGLYRIASFLHLFGINCEVVKESQVNKEFLQKLPFRPHIIGQRLATQKLQSNIMLSNLLSNQFPDALFIAGGHEITMSGRIFSTIPQLDAGILGWGEFSLLDMVIQTEIKQEKIDKTRLEQLFSHIGGIRTKDKLFKRKSAYTDMDFRIIFQAFNPKLIAASDNSNKHVYIHSSSHCAYNCSFCASKKFFTSPTEGIQKILIVKAEDIISRIQRIKKYVPDVTTIVFTDDNFFGNPRLVEEFAEQVEKLGLNKGLKFDLQTRLDSLERLPEHLLQRIARLGTKTLYVGIESPLPKVLKNINKGEKNTALILKYPEIIQKAKKAGITHVYAFIIILTPEESLDDTLTVINELIHMLYDLDINISLVQGIYIFPGTEMHNDYISERITALTQNIFPAADQGNTINIPTIALPANGENYQLLRSIHTGTLFSSVTAEIAQDYSALKRIINRNITDDAERKFCRDKLDETLKLHQTLLIASKLFIARRMEILKIVDTLLERRDSWIQSFLENHSPDKINPPGFLPAISHPGLSPVQTDFLLEQAI